MKSINDPKIAVDAARSELTSMKDLTLLASSVHIFVREAVAENPNTPVTTLEALFPSKLETEDDIRLVLAVVKNPKNSHNFLRAAIAKVQERLSMFEPRNFYPILLLEAIAAHPQVTVEQISPLLDPVSIPRHIRTRIAWVATQKELLFKLLEDPAETVRSKATKRLASLKLES